MRRQAFPTPASRVLAKRRSHQKKQSARRVLRQGSHAERFAFSRLSFKFAIKVFLAVSEYMFYSADEFESTISE